MTFPRKSTGVRVALCIFAAALIATAISFWLGADWLAASAELSYPYDQITFRKKLMFLLFVPVASVLFLSMALAAFQKRRAA